MHLGPGSTAYTRGGVDVFPHTQHWFILGARMSSSYNFDPVIWASLQRTTELLSSSAIANSAGWQNKHRGKHEGA